MVADRHTPGSSGRLSGLILARGTVDRASAHRDDEEWLAATWADQATRVLVLDSGQAMVGFGRGNAELILVPPAEAPEGVRFLLGVGDTGTAYFGVAGPVGGLGARPAPPVGTGPMLPPEPGVRPTGLRQAAALLNDRDAGLFTHAVAMANWHATHTHCPRCGELTEVVAAGHARRCINDGSEHFPRVDPAVIMAVTDDEDRCLLARNKHWPARRVSVLAGFVEPGESVEQAVRREVREETGLRVSEVCYVGSQPWPMPQSLMLGFTARAEGGQEISVDGEEIAEARWYSRQGLRDAMAEGQVALPPPVSIAHRIIETWYGGVLPGSW
ncbi:MAG TPA: NAD(+) diphosphatase [Streptosporangiaceae bacterium]|nr:NAD(+) diphosphatase [Streptosporangiaceae bacterium]